MGSELSDTAQAVMVEAQQRLDQLAEKAKEAHFAAQNFAATAVERALEAGRALLEARDLCPHGTWMPWLKKHFQHEVGTARSYMKAAKRWHVLAAQCPNAAQLPLRDVIKLLSHLVPCGSSEPAPTDTSASHRQIEGQPGAGSPATEPLSVSPTSSADDHEAVQMVVDLYHRLIEALRYVVQRGQRDTSYFELVLKALDRVRPEIEDFEESLRFALRQRRRA